MDKNYHGSIEEQIAFNKGMGMALSFLEKALDIEGDDIEEDSPLYQLKHEIGNCKDNIEIYKMQLEQKLEDDLENSRVFQTKNIDFKKLNDDFNSYSKNGSLTPEQIAIIEFIDSMFETDDLLEITAYIMPDNKDDFHQT